MADTEDEWIRQLAIRSGCTPIWSDYYRAWCCGCDDDRHIGDSQCSIITFESALRTRSERTWN